MIKFSSFIVLVFMLTTSLCIASETTTLNSDGKSLKVSKTVTTDITKETLIKVRANRQGQLDGLIAEIKAIDEKLALFPKEE